LGAILSAVPRASHPNLLVGNAERDDAAVFDLGDGTAVISTTDFFMPIVDDPADFGRIAAANALSDVYAMGGSPMLAIAILGWPANKLPPEVAGEVLKGATTTCTEAGIPLAGGHSIDNPEPIFGLAVTGRVALEHLKRNGGARPGDLLYLTKPLGVGILTTAEKRGVLAGEHASIARDSMVALNTFGAVLGPQSWVHAMTDITGFGLVGHLLETLNASGLGAELQGEQLPVFEPARSYLAQGIKPGGTGRNWASFGDQVGPVSDTVRDLLSDPQTSGGLLVAVDRQHRDGFEALASAHGLSLRPFGVCVEGEPLIRVV
jgi:selenide, water dikinase